MLPSAVALGLAALVALRLALARGSPDKFAPERRVAATMLAIALVIQSVHFAEETATGFPERLGALLGLPAMPMAFFVVFNLTWIGIWIASVPGLRSSKTPAFFAAWFLAIAGALNGIAHPLLAIAAGGYFPGLISSPVIGAAGIWLGIRLRRATEPVA